MRSVGQILQEKRSFLNKSFEEIEKETKIRKKYLELLEKNDFLPIKDISTVKGFIRNYAQALELNPDELLAIFRRDYSLDEKGQIVPKNMINAGASPNLYWTPKITAIFLGVLFLSLISFFLFKQYSNYSSPPFLEVITPLENQIIKEKVVVSGKTEKDAVVKIDGIPVLVNKDGFFEEEVILPRGESILTIDSTNRQGKTRTINRKLTIE
jgi:hypothetical protein